MHKYISIKRNPVVSALCKLVMHLFYNQPDTLIFCATTGRSGTKTLTHILSTSKSCVSLHEPHPVMSGQMLIEKNQGQTGYAEFYYRNVKSVYIRWLARNAKIYCEMNHMFIKTFSDCVIEDFYKKEIIVIHLIRNPLDVALSLTALDHAPGTKMGNTWYLDYKSKSNRLNLNLLFENDPSFSDPFFKALWYWYEIEIRVDEFRARYKEIRVIDFATENLSNKAKLSVLKEELGLEADNLSFNENSDIHLNRKKKLKSKTHKEVDRNSYSEMKDKFLSAVLLKHQIDLQVYEQRYLDLI